MTNNLNNKTKRYNLIVGKPPEESEYQLNIEKLSDSYATSCLYKGGGQNLTEEDINLDFNELERFLNTKI